MFKYIILICLYTLPFVGYSCAWMARNWNRNTDKWLDERFRCWLNRPLPSPGPKDRKRIEDGFHREEWPQYPYLMIDAILDATKDAEEVTKWAIYYTMSDAAQIDAEFKCIVTRINDRIIRG